MDQKKYHYLAYMAEDGRLADRKVRFDENMRPQIFFDGQWQDFPRPGSSQFPGLVSVDGSTIVADANGKISAKVATPSAEIWVDANFDGDVSDGTINKPFKSLSEAFDNIDSDCAIHMATGTYTEADDVTLPNFGIVLYGNNSTLNVKSGTGTITVLNPNFVRYDLNTIGNVIFSSSSPGRVLLQGGSVTGNITLNGLTDFKSITLTGGIITVQSTGQMLAIASTLTSRVVSSGILFIENCNFNTGKTVPLITSTAGQVVLANNLIYNSSTGGCVSCDNGATTNPNFIANNVLATASGAPVACGTAYTVYGRNFISGINTGTGYIPINSDMIGGGVVMALGSDATGDIYFRNSSALLARLPADTNGKFLRTNGPGTAPSFGFVPWSSVSDKVLATAEIDGLLSAAGFAKLSNITVGYLGYYATEAALIAVHATGTDGQFATIGETDTIWAWDSDTSAWVNTGSGSITPTWDSITGKPTVLAQYNGTVNDAGVITLENSVDVSDIVLGSVVKFTAANTAQGVAVGDLYQKKLQFITPDPAEYDDNTLIVSGAGDSEYNGTYVIDPAYGTSGISRKWYKNDSSGYYIWTPLEGAASGRWFMKDGEYNAYYTQSYTDNDPWLGVWVVDTTEGGVAPAPTVTRAILNNATDLLALFTPVGKIATSTREGLMSASDKTKLDGVESGVKPGTIVDYSGSSEDIPSSWLLCNGAAISRTTYAALFDVIGTKYGDGDGSTTFEIPKFYATFDNLVSVDHTLRNYNQIAKLGNDFYAAAGNEGGATGDIYKQTGGVGDFVSLAQANENWKGIVAHNGDLYVCVDFYNSTAGQIYKQTGGAGDFVSLAQTSRRWTGLYSVGDDVYCGTVGGEIYKQTGGTGDFALYFESIAGFNIYGMTSFNGDIYICGTGDIYKQTGGTGAFVGMGTDKNWYSIFVYEDSLYAVEIITGHVYRFISGTRGFVLCNFGYALAGRGILDGDSFFDAIYGYGIIRSNRTTKIIKY